jgi:hypothetical protein
MSSSELPAPWRLRPLGATLLAGCLALGGCAVATPSSQRVPGAQRASNPTCSLRAVVNIRQGSSIRGDSDLVEAGRRLGINISVLQTMGRNSRMVIFREDGSDAACEDSLAVLRNDLRIESIERY